MDLSDSLVQPGPSKRDLIGNMVVSGPSVEEKLFDELSLSDSSEFLDVEDETSLRKRLFPAQILTGGDSLDRTLVKCTDSWGRGGGYPSWMMDEITSASHITFVEQSDSDEFGSLDMSLPARAAEQAEHIVRKVLEEAENAEQLVRKLWGGAWKVCHFSHLPKWLQDNDFLHKGHRPPLRSFSACFRSIFRIHTETGNIWTHLLGCLLFVGIAAYFLSRPSELIPWKEKAVFATFFASAIICLGMSSMFHTVSCHSEPVGKLFSKLDYCGIAVLIIGSFVPWLYYGFYCDYQPKVFYFVLVSVLGAASIIVSMWDKFSEPQFRWLRAGVFAGFGLSGVIPAVHYLIVKGFIQAVYHASFGWLCLMGALYLLGAAFYALRVPERFFPGKCDIWFHSHQIFHVLVIAAAFVHYHGISEMAIYRLSMGTCSAEEPPIDFEY